MKTYSFINKPPIEEMRYMRKKGGIIKVYKVTEDCMLKSPYFKTKVQKGDYIAFDERDAWPMFASEIEKNWVEI